MSYTKTNWNDNTAPYINATNLNKIEQGIYDNDQKIVGMDNVLGYDEYNNSSTYEVGDYCIYNNKIYECNTAIATAEDFDSSKWNETSINGIIESVKSDVETNTSNISTNTNSIGTINTKIGALRVYLSGWTSSMTFTLPAGHIALVMSAQSSLYQLWNPDDRLNVNAITGSDLSFTRAADKTTITGTRSGNTTWAILVL